MSDRCLVCFEAVDKGVEEYHARCSLGLFGSRKPPKIDIGLDEIQDLAEKDIRSRVAIPGVQPKLSLTFLEGKKKSRLTIVGHLNGLFVLKPPHAEYSQLPEIEALTMSFAELARISVARHGLIRLKSGELAYIARRFDRVLQKKSVLKLPQEDLCQVLGLLTEDKYSGSIEKIGRAIRNHCTNVGYDLTVLFDVVLYSFLMGNSDMHLKNFSLLTNERGEIGISPAYDLVSTAVLGFDDEESALSINGKKNRLERKDFVALAQNFGLSEKVITASFGRLAKAYPQFETHPGLALFAQELRAKLNKLMRDRARRLEIV